MTTPYNDILNRVAQGSASAIDPVRFQTYERALDDAANARVAAGFATPLPPAVVIQSLAHQRDEALAAITELLIEREALRAALTPLKQIADAYDTSGLDEYRPGWGDPNPERIELYTGRGGKRLLTLAQAFAAREAMVERPAPVRAPRPAPVTPPVEEPAPRIKRILEVD